MSKESGLGNLSFPSPETKNTENAFLCQGVNHFIQSLRDRWDDASNTPITSRRQFLKACAVLGTALVAESVGLSVLPRAVRAQEEEAEVLGEQIGDTNANLPLDENFEIENQILPNITIELTSLENIAQVYGPNLEDWEEAAQTQGKKVWQLIMDTQREYIEKNGEPMPIPAPRKELWELTKTIPIETWKTWAKEANMEDVEFLLKMFFGTTSKEFLANPSYNRQELEALNELNRVRADAGLKLVYLDPYSTLAARAHAAYLTVNMGILNADPTRYHSDKAHIQRRDLFGFTGEQPSDRVRRFKPTDVVGATEVVGSTESPAENVQSWMASRLHRGIILSTMSGSWDKPVDLPIKMGYAQAKIGDPNWTVKGDVNWTPSTNMVFSLLKAA